MSAMQFCDCQMPLGSHRYEVKFSHLGREATLEGSVSVVPDLPPPDRTAIKQQACNDQGKYIHRTNGKIIQNTK